jgi:septal ring factor EnvC (AmiA/AmiB activator)
MPKTTIPVLLLSSLLVFSALAVPVLADDDEDGGDGPRHRRDGNQTADDGRHMRGDHNLSEHPRFARLVAFCANETLNDSAQERCDRLERVHDGAHKARRAAHALMGAIDALERRLDRINQTIADLENATADGNLTEEQLENITKRLERLEEHTNRTLERLEHILDRLERLHARWELVREHVAERRGSDESDDEDDDADEDED